MISSLSKSMSNNELLNTGENTIGKVSLKCLSKNQGCKSQECETIIECLDPLWSKNCYAMVTNNLTENQSNMSDTFQKYPQIRAAGCWAGGEECRRPIDILLKVDRKISYELPFSLRDPSIQDDCITYSHIHDVNSYNYRNNVSFCCCSKSLCNLNVFTSSERNPYEMYAQSLNPKINLTRDIIFSPPNELNDDGLNLKIVNAGLMTGILTFSLIFLLILLFTVLVFMYKKKFFFKNMASLPSVFFTRSHNDFASDLNNNNPNLVEPVSGSLNLSKLPEALNVKHVGSTELEDAQLIQPLLPQFHQPTFPSAVIAPNVVISDNPINSMALFNSMNSSKMNRLPTNKFINSNFGENIEMNQNVIPEDEHHVSSIRASDINLLEKISHGQFSAVWKGESKTKTEAEIYYAIKIFSSGQKNAWFNEKEIYNKLVKSPNDNILKYFGTDMHTSKKEEQQSHLKSAQFFFPALTSNEFWLITEYHSCGSLHDFLKANYVSWPQMINLCNCILEGLAYLHNEHIETRKSCAIAHRDLKSKNILVKNGGKSCCIGDLGLALKLNNATKLNSAEVSTMVGTRRYMSPELIEGAIAFTKDTFMRIDVYACALTLWEIVHRGDFYDEKCEYKLPFEKEVGSNPSLEDMKEVVVDKGQRPIIKSSWLKHYKIASIAQTIEECWDIDLDARISSECAASRIRKIHQTLTEY